MSGYTINVVSEPPPPLTVATCPKCGGPRAVDGVPHAPHYDSRTGQLVDCKQEPIGEVWP